MENSHEIQSWLSQFQPAQQESAAMLLESLVFISLDEYDSWIKNEIRALDDQKCYGLYSVRKLEDSNGVLWDEAGRIIPRPAHSLGSEDFVSLIISRVVKEGEGKYVDHPNLADLRTKHIRDIVLIEDTIGSGQRMTDYIRALQSNPTFMSWWSFGWLRIQVVSYARTREAEKHIVASVRGSDHSTRKFPKTSKIQFQSSYVYSQVNPEYRWGTNHKRITLFCLDVSHRNQFIALGFGGVMSNVIFYHSVPDNVPAVLWDDEQWFKPLFPKRITPEWLRVNLKDERVGLADNLNFAEHLDPQILHLLILVKGGNRRYLTLAQRLNCEEQAVHNLLWRARQLGLIDKKGRLTAFGFDIVASVKRQQPLPNYDRSLYIPQSWCAGPVNIQPRVWKSVRLSKRADFSFAPASEDGDSG